MDRELARKRPATVIAHPPIQEFCGRATIQTATGAKMMQRLDSLRSQGRIAPEWTVREGPRGWTADVIFIPRPARHRAPTPWLKIWAVSMASVLAVLAGYTLVQALALAIAAIVPFIVGGAFVLAAVALLAGRKIINISQNVNVR